MTTSFKYELIGRAVPSSWHLLAPTHQTHWQLGNRAASASPVSSLSSSQVHTVGLEGTLVRGQSQSNVLSSASPENSWPRLPVPEGFWKPWWMPQKTWVKQMAMAGAHSSLILGAWAAQGLWGCPSTQQPWHPSLSVWGSLSSSWLSKEIHSHELRECFPYGAAQTPSQEQCVEQSSTEPWRNAKYCMYESQHSCWNHKVLLSLSSLCCGTI